MSTVVEPALATALLRRAETLLLASNGGLARRLMRVALASRLDVQILLELARLMALADDHAGAEAAYEAASALFAGPMPASTHFAWGFTAARAGHLAAAERQFRICLALEPSHPQSAYALASLLTVRGEFAEADALFARDLPILCGDGRTTSTAMLRLPLPGRPLGWMPPGPARPAREVTLSQGSEARQKPAEGTQAVYLVAGDSRYLRLFARPLAASLAKAAGSSLLLHVHAVNPDAEILALLEGLGGSGSVPIAWSVERATLDGLQEAERRSFYACARFLVLPEVMELYGLPVLVADMDQLVLRSPLPLLGQLRDADIALLRFEDARHNLVSLVSATLALIGRSEGARAFAEMLRAWLLARMREPQGFSWHLDQAGLAVVHLSMRGLRWTPLNRSVVHLDPTEPAPDSPAVLWSITHSIAANAAKLETDTFRRLCAD